MKQSKNFSIECTTDQIDLKNRYHHFKEKLKKYLIDEDMELYRIPYGTDDYLYAHELYEKYYRDDDGLDDIPGLYVDESEILITDYSISDYENAVAYLIWFIPISDPYESLNDIDFAGSCCQKPEWSMERGLIQNKKYMIPKKEFRNKKYSALMIGYAIEKSVKQKLMDHNLASESDFQDVTDKNGDVVCIQIMPEHVIDGFANENHMSLVDKCKHCGMERYEVSNEPYFMSSFLVSELHTFNRTRELYGPAIENGSDSGRKEHSLILEPMYIVNRDVYLFLHKHYPKMQFIPIFDRGKLHYIHDFIL